MRKSFALILVIAICVIQTGCQNMPVSTVPSPEGNVSEQEVADEIKKNIDDVKKTVNDIGKPSSVKPEHYHF